MVRALEWHHIAGRPLSPFSPGVERALGVTLFETHDATPAERFAFEAIRNLASRPSLRIFDATPLKGASEPSVIALHIEINRETGLCRYRAEEAVEPGAEPSEEPWWSSRPLDSILDTAASHGITAEEVVAIGVHRLERHEIFATSSRKLLERQREPAMGDSNILNPLEAARILGLFLRGRGDWHMFRNLSVDRTGFYLGLAKELTPSLGAYFLRCYRAAKVRHDNTDRLASAVHERSVRVLQARDAIGLQFYQPQHNGTRDEVMYHFDYLAVLLSSALDAQARIARRAYAIQAREKNLNFWQSGFRDQLRCAGAEELDKILTDPKFRFYKDLLRTVRNTVHEAGLMAIAVHSRGAPSSRVEGQPDDRQTILAAVEGLGGTEAWGVSANGLEPYTFALKLVDQGLALIDSVAAATDVSRLSPERTTTAPPAHGQARHSGIDRMESEVFRRRLRILGNGTA